MGQPLDTSMQPMSIMAAQPKPVQGSQQPGTPMQGRKGKTAIDKLAQSYQTPLQAAEAHKGMRKH